MSPTRRDSSSPWSSSPTWWPDGALPLPPVSSTRRGRRSSSTCAAASCVAYRSSSAVGRWGPGWPAGPRRRSAPSPCCASRFRSTRRGAGRPTPPRPGRASSTRWRSRRSSSRARATRSASRDRARTAASSPCPETTASRPISGRSRRPSETGCHASEARRGAGGGPRNPRSADEFPRRQRSQGEMRPREEGAAMPERTTDRNRWIALYVLCVGMLMIVLDVTVVNVALPSIQNDLGFSQSSLAWVVNAYLIAFGGLLLLAGRFGDLIGRKTVFLSGLAVFTLASLVCGLAQSQEMLVIARFVQGAGGAMTSAVILGMIVTMFPEQREQAKAIGVFAFVASAGGSIGLLLGGILTEAINWHWIFFVNLPIGVVTAVLAVR